MYKTRSCKSGHISCNVIEICYIASYLFKYLLHISLCDYCSTCYSFNKFVAYPYKYLSLSIATEMNCLLNQLDEFEKLLNQAENHLTRKGDLKSSIIQVLNDLSLCEYGEKLISLIPKTILVCHYVHFRMTLRK